jgi:hypothetical protein
VGGWVQPVRGCDLGRRGIVTVAESGASSLFPDLPGHSITHGWGEDAKQRKDEADSRQWWAQWEREHPPDRTCLWCGKPGGKLWLTTDGVGPRPCHRECAGQP